MSALFNKNGITLTEIFCISFCFFYSTVFERSIHNSTHTHTHTHTPGKPHIIWVAQMVKDPPAMQETWVQSLGWEDPLEEGMATHSNIPAWRIPMDREAWRATVHVVTKSWTRLCDSAQHIYKLYIYFEAGIHTYIYIHIYVCSHSLLSNYAIVGNLVFSFFPN